MPEILYTDKNIIICVKPAGVPSQPAPGRSDDMVSLLSREFSRGVYAVHRLDTAVGGVMVYALNRSTAAELCRMISDNSDDDKLFFKEYLAIVHGQPKKSSGKMEDLLFHDPVKNKTYTVERMRKGVRYAELEYDTLAVADTSDGLLSLISVRLMTGRTHQIRVQFSSRSMPLAGDRRYGAHDKFGNIGLLSRRLAFSFDNKNFDYSCSPPDIQPWIVFKDRYDIIY